MKKILSTFGVATLLLCLMSCAKDIVDVNGTISGSVKDYDDGHSISNCQVSLSPVGKTCVTSTEGTFNFADLEPGSYTLSFSKSGYHDQTKTVTVVSGQNSDVSITMKTKGAFSLSETKLDFGDFNSSLSVTIFNNSDTNCSFEIGNIPEWAVLSHTSGLVAAQSSLVLTVVVDRDKVDYGLHSKALTIAYKATTQGSTILTLTMQKVKLSVPTVAIATEAKNITQSGFEVIGQITATGGSVITEYGHCWSTSPNPTIDDAHSTNGVTQTTCDFTTIATNLELTTTYYVRAYATNAQGTAYSNQIAVTTLDVASNKWDGTLAKKFAGGDGSKSNPYKVETGGQLLLMKDYADQHFVLAANIDLDNKNWLPFEFSGELDGAGYIISNLYVDRVDEGQGLFSEILSPVNSEASIHDLTIKNVKISTTVNYVGALAGYAGRCSINNVSVILNEKSVIKGGDYVGGLVGAFNMSQYNGIEGLFNGCRVTANDDASISGNNTVGGLVGDLSRGNYSEDKWSMTNAHVSANVVGAKNVGGIVGQNYGFTISNCSYKGIVDGEAYSGGILGYGSNTGGNIIACKAEGTVKGNNYVGGIQGSSNSIIASYFVGTITGSSDVNGLGDTSGSGTYLSYSIVSDVSGFSYAYDCATTSSKGDGRKNSVTNCTDITTHLKSAYSEYAEYYNFDNTWIWEDKVNGKTVQVSCPKLYWEE